jgi:pyridoxal phosphate enzyme (YggS family)
MTILQNYIKIINNISNLTSKTKLIVVCKNQNIDKIQSILDYGHKDFGENKVQEAKSKWSQNVKDKYNINLHLIGSLQSNKAEIAFNFFDFIHTLDNEKLANIFSKLENNTHRKINYFIQVNIGNEIQKSGIDINELVSFSNYCKNELKLNVLGLMCIPPVDKDPDEYFSELRNLNIKNSFNDLSIGMSSDYEKAIKYDSTFVRVGSSIFKENSN